ncbi:hypothetical protein AB0C07_34740 [Actinoplanes missouriensis]|uniref:hypothetical protein n=1 Tax=Actinoplanes missouriensis TaxID=1866 RepID=UPI0033CC4961
MNNKLGRFVAVAGAALVAALTVLAPTAASADTASTLAAGCRAAPYSATFSPYFETEAYSDLGVYRTTSQCTDINIRSTNSTGYNVCVIFTRYNRCNYTTYVPAGGQWVNAATDVLDGTTFYLRVYKGGANYVVHAGVMDF